MVDSNVHINYFTVHRNLKNTFMYIHLHSCSNVVFGTSQQVLMHYIQITTNKLR